MENQGNENLTETTEALESKKKSELTKEEKALLKLKKYRPEDRKKWATIEYVGLATLIVFLGAICFFPGQTGAIFDAMLTKCFDVIVPNFITGNIIMSVIVGFIVCGVLERLGMTDALLRIFQPIARWMGYNPTVIIAPVYNIVGDVLAASKVAPPVMKAVGSTKDDYMIAMATNILPSGNFTVIVLSIIALATAGVNALLVVLLSCFIPIIVTPWLLSHTIWRKTKKIAKTEPLPLFTPNINGIDALFNSAKAGAYVGFLVVIPTVAAIMCIIGILEYIGVWVHVTNFLGAIFGFLHINPELGVIGLTTSPVYAASLLTEAAATMDKQVVIGTAMFLMSALPIVTTIGQVPAVWAENAPITTGQAIGASLVGLVFKLIWIGIFVTLLGFVI